MRLSEETLRGRTVISADGQAVGEVDGLFFESGEWRVDALVVKLRREASDALGAQRSLLHSATVEIPMRFGQSVGDAVLLSVALDSLRQFAAGREGEAAR